MKYSIYIHQNLKIYVGYSNNPKRRWNETNAISNNPNHRSYKEPFYKAIRREGWDGFTHQVIEEWDTKEEALEAEKFWIEFFRSNRTVYGKDYGYNLTAGGEGGSFFGRTHSPETRAKLSKANRGRKHTTEAIEKIVQVHLGSKRSEETKGKISLSQKGKKLSPEHIENLSLSHKGTGMGNTNAATLTKEQVLEIRASTGSYSELAKKYGVSYGTIRNIKTGKTWKHV